MKIDDKEIDKLLEEFYSEEIKVPQILEEKLNSKLNELKPKRKNKLIKSLVASILILVLSYSVIPGFKTFADNIFKYIFGDIGVENAVNNGYKSIPNQSININGYRIDIENIYMDNLRITFDVNIKVDKEVKYDEFESEIEQYSIQLLSDEFDKELEDYSCTVEYKGYDDTSKSFKSSVQLIGKSNNSLLKFKDNKVNIDIELVKHYSILKGEEWEQKEDVLGKSKIVFNAPKDLMNSEIIDINKSISEDRISLDIERLEISPTMMYLDTNGKIDEKLSIEGLYDFKIISDSNNIYKDNMTLSATKNENGGTRQTIVPSIYYDNSKKFELKAEGVLVEVKDDIKISENSIYPKSIDLFNSKINITNVFYKNGKLTVEVTKNQYIVFAGSSLLDGEYGVEEYQSGDTLGIVFETNQKDEYNLSLSMMMKYKYPISININRE